MRDAAIPSLLTWVLLCTAACEKPQPTLPRPRDPASLLQGGRLVFEDPFEGDSLSDDWETSSDVWKVKDGEVQVRNARNAGLWLKRPLPRHVRVEFDALSEGVGGDLKFEIFAKERTHQSGYIAVLGGWNNKITVLARLDEHGADRMERRDVKVKRKTHHHFAAVRGADDVFYWLVDGEVVHKLRDPEPLQGRFFGLNDWTAPVRFDNVRVYDLDGE